MIEGDKGEILLILNPIAGKGRAVEMLHEYLPVLEEHDTHVTIYYTKEAGDAISLVRTEGQGYKRIIAAGGDGTLNELVNGVISGNVQADLGYLPIGTTCDFAATLGLPKDLAAAAEIAKYGTPQELDCGLFNNKRNFIYVASFGAFTDVSYDTPVELKNNIGRMAYFVRALKNLSNLPNLALTLETAENSLEGNFLFGAVLNTTQLGGFLKLDPAVVSLDDGYFEILLVRYPKGPADVTAIINGLMNMDYSGSPFVFFKSKEAVFRFQEEVAWTLDGEYGGAAPIAAVKVLPKAWKLTT